MTIEADAGRSNVNIALPDVGVVVDDRGRLSRLIPAGGPLFDMSHRSTPIGSVSDGIQQYALTYNGAGRLKRVASSSQMFTITYNSAGLVAQLDLGSGVTQSFTYNSSGHLTGFSDSGGDTASLTYSAGHLVGATITLTQTDPSFSFAYGSAGVLTSWSQTAPVAQTWNVQVDSSGDVTTVTRGQTSDVAISYVGPRTPSQVSIDGGSTIDSFTYDGARRLSTVTAGGTNTTSFLYDSAGRFSSVTYPVGSSTTESASFTYDSLGRVVGVSASSGKQVNIVYLPAPVARTYGATNIARTSAKLNGAVNPHGLSARYRFQFGRTQNYGQLTPTRSTGVGNHLVAVTAWLAHLTPGTTYHYRLVAKTAAGTTFGADRLLHTK